jgi:hypothetical protein
MLQEEFNWLKAIGRERSATDQPPGTYRYRARRKAPWQPVRILWDGEMWHCLLTGRPVRGSGTCDPMDIPFIRDRAPFHPVSEIEYLQLVLAYEAARPGSPLLTPDEPVDMRRSAPL